MTQCMNSVNDPVVKHGLYRRTLQQCQMSFTFYYCIFITVLKVEILLGIRILDVDNYAILF